MKALVTIDNWLMIILDSYFHQVQLSFPSPLIAIFIEDLKTEVSLPSTKWDRISYQSTWLQIVLSNMETLKQGY